MRADERAKRGFLAESVIVRIGIARVLPQKLDVCLMDEPSSALDALHEKELPHTLRQSTRERRCC
ncbi:MAG: hypothetical protein ACLUD2_17580 [Clostridium sp.]